jgi:hypothetical protein
MAHLSEPDGKEYRDRACGLLQSQRTAIATSAHQQKKLIVCYGNLIKKSRLLMLENPHSLAILD